MKETAYEQGKRWGRIYRSLRTLYSKKNGCYPSNPYPVGSQEQIDYDIGYEELDKDEFVL